MFQTSIYVYMNLVLFNLRIAYFTYKALPHLLLLNEFTKLKSGTVVQWYSEGTVRAHTDALLWTNCALNKRK